MCEGARHTHHHTAGSFFWSVLDVLQHCFVDTDQIKAQTQSDCLPRERYSMIVHGSHVSLKKESQTSEILFFLHSVCLGRFCYRAKSTFMKINNID